MTTTAVVESRSPNNFTFSFSPIDFVYSWPRISMMSNFAAEYYRCDFSTDDEYIRISTVLNELIENAVKFSRDKACPISVTIKRKLDGLDITVTNSIAVDQYEQLALACLELEQDNIEDVMEDKADRLVDSRSSGIGLLLIKSAYGTSLRFDFMYSDGRPTSVSVTAEILFDQWAATY